MITFRYTISDPHGIHARPAGLLAKLAKKYEDTVITITKGEATVKAGQLMKLMGLGIRQGDEVVISVEGTEEEEAAGSVWEFLERYL